MEAPSILDVIVASYVRTFELVFNGNWSIKLTTLIISLFCFSYTVLDIIRHCGIVRSSLLNWSLVLVKWYSSQHYVINLLNVIVALQVVCTNIHLDRLGVTDNSKQFSSSDFFSVYSFAIYTTILIFLWATILFWFIWSLVSFWHTVHVDFELYNFELYNFGAVFEAKYLVNQGSPIFYLLTFSLCVYTQINF